MTISQRKAGTIPTRGYKMMRDAMRSYWRRHGDTKLAKRRRRNLAERRGEISQAAA